jgi:signal transduction histidine kinase
MPRQKEPGMQPSAKHSRRSVPQSDVVAAFTTFSRLAARTSTLQVTSPAVARRWAKVLLKRVLALCEAQQGALFVASVNQPGHATPTPCTTLEQPGWSLFTNLHCLEADAYTSLQTVASGPDVFHCSEDLPATVCWKRALPAGKTSQAARTHPVPPFVVAFVLRWSPHDRQKQETARQQAIQLLPLLADLIDTILVHIFSPQVQGGTVEPRREIMPAELLATIGHELRGPLTTIQGYAQTLVRYDSQLAPAERLEFLHAISHASAHIGQLVNRFLELAQFETHTAAFFPAPINMRALAQESLTAAQEGQARRLLLLPTGSLYPQAVTSSPEEPSQDALTLEGDRRSLRTMLDILLENALAYSAPDSLIEVFLEPCTFVAEAALPALATAHHPLALILPAPFHDQEPLLEIGVRDHGRGIAPEELSAIFQRFYRGDTSLTRETNGLGLGLALCQAIVAQHRGMLWVESALGEGSTFHVVLPLRQTVPDQDDNV